MRVMMIVKASPESEAGEMPSRQLIAEMGNFNQQMMDAGIMLAGDGLHPSSKGRRVRYSGKKRSVIDGPFAESKELIAGYWVIEVKSLDEAVEWAKRCPFEDGEVELRPLFETSDFPADILPPDEAAREDAWREQLQKKTSQS